MGLKFFVFNNNLRKGFDTWDKQHQVYNNIRFDNQLAEVTSKAKMGIIRLRPQYNRSMDSTVFSKKLKSYVWGTKSSEGHWFLKEDAPTKVRPPGFPRPITTKRALYATFLGDIPAGMELRTGCDTAKCVRPEHQDLCAIRNGADSPVLTSEEVNRPNLKGPGTLPKGITKNLIKRIKALFATGSDIAGVAYLVGLSYSEVMKCKNGIYDRAVASAEAGGRARKGSKGELLDEILKKEAFVPIVLKSSRQDEKPLAAPRVEEEKIIKKTVEQEEQEHGYDYGPDGDSEMVAWLRSIR